MTTKTTKKKSTPAAKKPAAATYRPEVMRLAKFLMQRTLDNFGAAFTTKKQPLSEKAMAIQKYINENMGSYKTQAATLFGMLLGENIADDCALNREAEKGSLLIPTGNDNSHDYPLGQIAMVGDHGLSNLRKPTEDWRYGNHITTTLEHLRLPTEEEVLKFADANFDKLVSVLGVVIL